MQAVRYVACVNEAWFVMKFRAEWRVGDVIVDSGWTDDYARGDTKVIDLTTCSIPSNGAVWVAVHAEAGNTVDGPEVVFDPGSLDTATYSVSGTTLSFQVGFSSA